MEINGRRMRKRIHEEGRGYTKKEENKGIRRKTVHTKTVGPN